uniref:Uncharacterized protein n=1 Tax=uncultured prokaryote TaxID=198431 RepID=A0A0H5Q1M7_9ZZZZ|nr:hypothetical protein [uncultured prokaryote]
MPFNLSETNDLAAILTSGFTFAGLYLVGNDPLRMAIGLAVLAGGAVLGYTGYTSPAAASAAAPAVKA